MALKAFEVNITIVPGGTLTFTTALDQFCPSGKLVAYHFKTPNYITARTTTVYFDGHLAQDGTTYIDWANSTAINEDTVKTAIQSNGAMIAPILPGGRLRAVLAGDPEGTSNYTLKVYLIIEV